MWTIALPSSSFRPQPTKPPPGARCPPWPASQSARCDLPRACRGSLRALRAALALASRRAMARELRLRGSLCRHPPPLARPAATSPTLTAPPCEPCARPWPLLCDAPWPAGCASGGARTAAELPGSGIAGARLELAGRRPSATLSRALARSPPLIFFKKCWCQNWCNVDGWF
jgi:hypothetical protein